LVSIGVSKSDGTVITQRWKFLRWAVAVSFTSEQITFPVYVGRTK